MIVRVVQCFVGLETQLTFPELFSIGARFLGKGPPGQEKRRFSAVFREKTHKRSKFHCFLFNGFYVFLQVSIGLFFFLWQMCPGFRPCGSLLVARAG